METEKRREQKWTDSDKLGTMGTENDGSRWTVRGGDRQERRGKDW